VDLIVDGKNGWAYLHPKPPKRPDVKNDAANAPATGGNWTLAENVRVSSDNFFIYSGEYKWSTNNLKGALADFNPRLELNPANADACSSRGAVREIQGDSAKTCGDLCTKIIENQA